MSITAERWVAMAIEEGLTLYGDGLPLKEMAKGTSLVAIARQLAEVARFVRPEDYMPLVPPSVQRFVKELTLNPPASIEDLFYIESFIHKASYFEGLSEEQARAKVAQDELARKQERFNALWALHRYLTDA